MGAIDGAAVTHAIRLAAVRTGVDYGYLVAQARIESGLDPHAAAQTSSARGLFQFTQATWLDTVRRHGAEYGLADAAAVLKRGATPEERVAILDLRHDAGLSSAMAAAFAQDNAATLERRLGRTANATDLYLAHFLGPTGAVRFLQARDATPDAAAAGAVLPAAARANAGVFTAAGGRPRSLDEVYARFAAKLGSAPASGNALPPTGTVLPVGTDRPVVAVAAARTAYLLLADLGE